MRLLLWLAEDASGGDAASILLRGFAYQAIGQLAARAPQPFQEDTTIARAMFGALATEPPGVRASLQEAVSSLASAYKGCSGVQRFEAAPAALSLACSFACHAVMVRYCGQFGMCSTCLLI